MFERACLEKRSPGVRPNSVPRLKLTAFSLVSLFLVPLAVRAQTPQPQRPPPHETARPGTSQGFLGWLRQLAPSPHRQSRAASPPLPRPRPAELTPAPVQPIPVQPHPASEGLAPAAAEPHQTPAQLQQNKGHFLHFVLETPHSLSTRPDAYRICSPPESTLV
jgi:hypothetical protein